MKIRHVMAAAYILAVFRLNTAAQTADTKTEVDSKSSRSQRDAVLQLDKVEVQGKQESFDNAIDRKIYHVGKDLQSAAGSASELLQNVPAVQVDIEGNVSLRGSSDVTVLINGKSSALMGRNRAAALEQMPSNMIERIEVITNPSAKYRPDGTAGIINIVMKSNQGSRTAGSVRVNVGNDQRYNLGVSGNVHAGAFVYQGSAAFRQDDRLRESSDTRIFSDPDTGVTNTAQQQTSETSRPRTRILQGSVEYVPRKGTTLGADVSYNYRDFLRRADQRYTTSVNGGLVSDYKRERYDPEYEEDIEFGSTLAHSFTEDRELSVAVKRGRTVEQEDNFYRNTYDLPTTPFSANNNLIKVREDSTEATADFSSPLGKDAKLEAGYAGLFAGSDADFRVSNRDPISGIFVPDSTRTNRFQYDSRIHALYLTYERHHGAFGAMAGLRFEEARIETHQITTGQEERDHYQDFYPTLHLTYELPAAQQLQFNYSRRVRRPEGDDFNPFPEYQDPFNLRAGNPHLQPEQIHSIEAGWQLKNNDTTYLATAYYRYRYNGITEVTRFVDSTTLLTTKENLSTSRASGIELGAARRFWDRLGLNFSGNIYRSEIDAGNLGFTEPRSAVAWDAKVNLGWDVSPATLVQFNANYSAKRLTPQGYRYPTSVFNIGLRHTLTNKKVSVVATVSDVFDSLRERTLIDTPSLHNEANRRRNPRILYVGFIYNFGGSAKPQKDDIIFDNAP
jgi:outer membrane receptor protein involved in Fe transport